MKITYKNPLLEKLTVTATACTSAVVIATFVLLYGFEKPLLPTVVLHIVQVIAFLILLAEKAIRFVNALSKRDYLRVNWFEIPVLLILAVFVLVADRYSPLADPAEIRILAISVYLVFQVVIKACKGTVSIASTGKNPTSSLITIFLILILVGATALTLPRSYTGEKLSFTDAMFTATSATCVTGLIVKDTGADFSPMGQIIILTLIQLGGLGIVIFGAVLALLLGQALTVRESVAMQDLLSSQTLGRIGNIIAFIFITTLIIEGVGAISLVPMYAGTVDYPGFNAIFHSISAFCNAGFSLQSDSLMTNFKHPAVYSVIAPLIILGGLGFGVLYNITVVVFDKIKRAMTKTFNPTGIFELKTPRKISLQTKIVITTSIALIALGTLAFLILENNGPNHHSTCLTNGGTDSTFDCVLGAFFQSVTARTAGFNTIDIAQMSPASKMVMIILMLIGGSPGSTAGGIKTVTVAIMIMTTYATLRKRREVEIFKRSVRPIVVGRAITVMILFAAVLFAAMMALTITERNNAFEMSDIAFETASALGTVGLSTGITASLTTLGKWIIIAVMLIGRLGPLTLMAAMTFNIRPASYSYPSEPVIVG